MDSDKKDEKSVYGHNIGEERATEKPGIREKGTGEDLEAVRDRTEEPGGGAGHSFTPKSGPSEGEWEHDDNAEKANPRPPVHAPGSDEVPS